MCRRLAICSLLALASSGIAGCAGSQVTHFSGQIGRFHEDGISFTVPMIERSENLSGEDRFWEIRRNIGDSVVVVLAPLEDGVRSNMTLTKSALSKDISTPEIFRQQQVEELSKEVAGQIEESQDGGIPCASFYQEKEGVKVRCKAWFFVNDKEEPSCGYVLLGTAPESDNLSLTMEKFSEVARTFTFGQPSSGFAKYNDVLNVLVSKVVPEEKVEPIKVRVEGEEPAKIEEKREN